jgi:hypothetical protein
MFNRSGTAGSRSLSARALLLASIATLVVTAFDAHAAPVARASAATGEQLAAADGADFSSRKRYRARRGNAAGLAMMGMVAGTIGAVIAADQERRAYRRAQYYYDPYYGDPYAYRQPYAYGAPRAYHQPRVYHHPRAYRQPYGGVASPHDRRQRIDPQNPNSANPTGVPRIGW